MGLGQGRARACYVLIKLFDVMCACTPQLLFLLYLLGFGLLFLVVPEPSPLGQPPAPPVDAFTAQRFIELCLTKQPAPATAKQDGPTTYVVYMYTIWNSRCVLATW